MQYCTNFKRKRLRGLRLGNSQGNSPKPEISYATRLETS